VRVGIGTTAPGSIVANSKMDVFGGHILVSNNFGVLSANSDNNGFGAGFDTGTEDDLYLYAGGVVRLTLSSSTGNLTLESGAAYKPGGGSWSAISDRRLKKDITAYKKGLSDILKIQPKKFRYIELSGYDSDKEIVGVIAQELQTIAPEMIGHVDIEGEEYLSVDNSDMIYMLVNAVKELSTQNQALSVQNETLSAQSEFLTQENNQLKVAQEQTQMVLMQLVERLDKLEANHVSGNYVLSRGE